MSKHKSKGPKVIAAPDPEMKTIEQSNALSDIKNRRGMLSTLLGAAEVVKGPQSNAYGFTGKEAVNAAEEYKKNNSVDNFYNQVKSEGYGSDAGFLKKALRKVEARRRYNEGLEKASGFQTYSKTENNASSVSGTRKKASASAILGS